MRRKLTIDSEPAAAFTQLTPGLSREFLIEPMLPSNVDRDSAYQVATVEATGELLTFDAFTVKGTLPLDAYLWPTDPTRFGLFYRITDTTTKGSITIEMPDADTNIGDAPRVNAAGQPLVPMDHGLTRAEVLQLISDSGDLLRSTLDTTLFGDVWRTAHTELRDGIGVASLIDDTLGQEDWRTGGGGTPPAPITTGYISRSPTQVFTEQQFLDGANGESPLTLAPITERLYVGLWLPGDRWNDLFTVSISATSVGIHRTTG